MELSALKSVWDEVGKEADSTQYFDEYEVINTIRKTSKNVLSKVKRVMYFKFVFGGFSLLTSAIVLIGTFIVPEKVNFMTDFFSIAERRVFLLSIVIFLCGMIAMNYKAFVEIKLFNRSSETIKGSLKRAIGIMEKTIKINIYSGAIFNAAFLSWLVCTIAFRHESFTLLMKGFVVVVVPFVAFSLSYLLSSYEQKLKFGHYLNQLKTCLKETEEV